ncbi:MAG: hypothetical protein LBD06_12485 [Candidatus Accumulibacter sp.]|nr:hypothetical protein [Accumulibacter sp.]
MGNEIHARFLGVIVLECVKNGGVELGDLFRSRSGRVTITVSDCPDAFERLVDGLNAFIAAPTEFGINEFLSEEELAKFVADCRKIYDELGTSLPDGK